MCIVRDEVRFSLEFCKQLSSLDLYTDNNYNKILKIRCFGVCVPWMSVSSNINGLKIINMWDKDRGKFFMFLLRKLAHEIPNHGHKLYSIYIARFWTVIIYFDNFQDYGTRRSEIYAYS